jgi:hypothetical protein
MVVKAIERIARYMLGTADEGLRLQGSADGVKLHVASDADDAGGMSRRSIDAVLRAMARRAAGG